MTYSLLYEPWIPVRKSGRLAQVGLIALFKNWESIQDVSAANPPRQIALYRFLIAIVHAALRGPRSASAYQQLWEQDDLGTQIYTYLEKWAERFDLQHPERPFLQSPDIAGSVGETAIGKAVYQDANTPIIWFKPGDTPWLTAADAAQELLRMQSLELGGRKSDLVTAGPGRWTQGRHVFPSGTCLRETLLLNLAEYEPEDTDLPVWESQTPIGSGERYPKGYLDWLTFCERRILLSWAGDRATHLRLASGWKPDPLANVNFDHHQAFRLTDSGWFPKPLSPERQVWEDSEALLHTVVEQRERPKIFNWLIQTVGLLDPQPVRILGFAHAGGTQAAKPVHWVDDALAIPEAVLEDVDVWRWVEEALALARDFGKVFGSVTVKRAGERLDRGTQKILIAQMPTLQAAMHTYIAQKFPRLMLDVADQKQAPAVLKRWRQELRQHALKLAKMLHTALPDFRSRAVVESLFAQAIHTVAKEKAA
ncbi:MAG: type I-E CRISPR-associated protein Cse1/CasA [Bryobacteraceae bacterium]|nr:type I-E CRISPR-associated protein Cse1/CasA [Bryobacteraceae bacterium]